MQQQQDLPWVEKYRPRILDEVVGNDEAIRRLRVIARDGNMPNLLLSGPPGAGKTTCILALARELLGASYRDAVLELNASDDRGIDVVRGTIKMFAHKKVTLPAGRHKIIVLDEADSMTPAAQQALRRTMEVYSSTTRFALACNYSSEVIEPLQSRCAVVRFSRLTDADVESRTRAVAQAEHVEITDDGADAIVYSADGDLRHALNTLQAAQAGFGRVDAPAVYKVADQPHPAHLRRALALCAAGEFDEAHRIVLALAAQGYSPSDLVSALFRVAKALHRDLDISDAVRLEFLKEIGTAHAASAVDGVDTRVQLSGLVARLCLKYHDAQQAAPAAAAAQQ
eukprot:m51a1_g834 putative replication factor c subunit 2-like (340) ;mRNA; r:741705-742724